MTPEDQIKAIAELDGFQLEPKGYFYYRNGDIKGQFVGDSFTLGTKDEPNYLTSLDAIVPVIERATSDGKVAQNFMFELAKLKFGEDWSVDNSSLLVGGVSLLVYMLSTPCQLCEALLRATRKWIE